MSEHPFPYTPVRIDWRLPKLKSRSGVCGIGSCFSENLMDRLLLSGMRGAQNPNGILYNPYSINHALQMLDVGYDRSSFFFFNGKYCSWAHHGSFSDPDLLQALGRAETARKKFRSALKRASYCIITVSSALVYKYLPEMKIVANCHKVPGRDFERYMFSAEGCFAALFYSCRKIRELNPDCSIVFTLSPVRHYPGELSTNALSKARLLCAIYSVLEKVENAAYFPAWEIVNDELRDYRFYAEDMLHPSELARKIVFDRFLDCCCEPDVRGAYEEGEQRRRRAAHIEKNLYANAARTPSMPSPLPPATEEMTERKIGKDC